MGRVINVGSESFKGGEIKPIPQGTKVQATVYAIEEVAVKTGDNAGKPQLDVTFKVQEPGQPYNGREIRFQKIPLYDNNAAWKLVTFAEAVGWKAEDGKGVSIPDNIQEVLGTQLTIKVNEKTPDAQGRVFNEVGGYAKADTTGGSVVASNATPSWGALNG
jgi:Protein of unknown function (DUF669).